MHDGLHGRVHEDTDTPGNRDPLNLGMDLPLCMAVAGRGFVRIAPRLANAVMSCALTQGTHAEGERAAG